VLFITVLEIRSVFHITDSLIFILFTFLLILNLLDLKFGDFY